MVKKILQDSGGDYGNGSEDLEAQGVEVRLMRCTRLKRMEGLRR